ncbi:hypothetical protein [Hwanghaeella sp.]|uniref:hypothetical protein n=1 Tax=Hwanghaeella sp. TaxID=2605943 RepID=UPI003CCC1F86
MTSFGNGTQKGMARRMRGMAATLALVAMATPAVAGSVQVACEQDADFKDLGANMIVAPANVDSIPRGEKAKAVRFLQSELMVAALACDARQQYGNFVQRYKVSLVSSGRDLKNHFEKAHGQKKGFAELNRFVTRMANKASGRMASFGAGFCSDMHATYEHLLSQDTIQLSGYSLGYQARVESQEKLVAAGCDQPQQLSAVTE